MAASQNNNWASSVEKILDRAPRFGTTAGPDPLHAQVRLLALLGSGAPLEALLDGLAHYVETWSPGLLCSVLTANAAGTHLRPAAAPHLPAEYVRAIDPVEILDGRGSCGTAAARGELVIVEDIATSPLWSKSGALAVGHALRACWSVPFFDDERRLLGTLALYYHEPHAPSPDELDLIRFAASLASFVVQRHRDSDRLRLSTHRLNAAVGGTNIGIWDSDVKGDGDWFDDWCERVNIDACRGANRAERWLALIHPDDRAGFMAADRDCRSGSADHYITEYRVRTRAGDWHWLHERGSVTERDEAGRALRYVGVCFSVNERKRLEDELRSVHERYEFIIDAARLPVWEYDVASDALLGNTHWHRTAGYDLGPEEARGRRETWLSDVHPDDLAAHAGVFAGPRADASGFYEAEFRIRTPDGAYRWLLDRGRVVDRDAAGRPTKVVGVSVEIDTLKRLELALRASEARLEATADGSDIGLWDWHVGEGGLAWLSDWPRRRGLKETQEPSTLEEVLAAVHEGDRARLSADLDDLRTGRCESIATDYRFRDPGGEYRWIQVRARVIERGETGAATRLVGACMDVDVRRRNEERLSTHGAIVDTMVEAVAVLDGAGAIEFTNAAFARMFGAPSDGGAARAPAAAVQLAAALASPGDPLPLLDGRGVPARLQRADGSWFEAEVAGREIDLPSGKRRIVVVTDVTEHRRLEHEILDVVSRERHRLGRELHDGLGQELTGVALMLKSLATRTDDDRATARLHLNEAIAVVNHAIDSTRAIARGLAPVSLDDGGLVAALRDLVRRSRIAYGTRITFRSRATAGVRLPEAEASHLYRIAQEAVNNAAKHGKAREIRISMRGHASALELTVSDDGVGIGTATGAPGGMGLRIMRYRAHAIGGALKIHRRRQGGTRVWCRCPV
ncbi:MAG: PAS domain-containing protein [Proteobacteria bacterium]|nr:PAS domain-containing protein [Pseudomonadota bacterium]